MPDYADYNDPGATATAIGATSLVGTGLAKESGGNLDTHTSLLSGASAGALIAGAGRTVGQEVAALIASGSAAGVAGGVPLLHGHGHLLGVSAQVIAASGNFTPATVSFTKPSYLIRIDALMSGVNANMPSVKLNIQWRSSTTGSLTLDSQVWYVPAGGSSATRSTIKGPVLGDRMVVTLSNGDTTDSVTVNFDVYEGTWPASRHDGRSTANVGLGGGSPARDDTTALVLANDTFNVPGNTTVTKSLALYAGQVNIWLNQNTQAGSALQVIPFGDFTTGIVEPIANLDWTVAPHQLVGVVLPRCWCVVIFINNGAVAATATWSVTALEFAS